MDSSVNLVFIILDQEYFEMSTRGENSEAVCYLYRVTRFRHAFHFFRLVASDIPLIRFVIVLKFFMDVYIHSIGKQSQTHPCNKSRDMVPRPSSFSVPLPKGQGLSRTRDVFLLHVESSRPLRIQREITILNGWVQRRMKGCMMNLCVGSMG